MVYSLCEVINVKKKHVVAGLYIDDFFQFDNQLYGLLLSEDHKDFRRFVLVTYVGPDHINWTSINETMEKAVRYFYEQKSSRKK